MNKKLIMFALKIAVIFLFFAAICPIDVKAEGTGSDYTIEEYMNFDTSKADEAAGYSQGGIKDTAIKMVSGEFSFLDLADSIAGGLFTDISKQINSIKKITALIIVCGLLKSISSSLGGKEVNDLCFFVCYSVIIYIIMSSFIEEIMLVKENIQRFASVNTAMIPVFMVISAMSGRAVSSAALSSVVMIFSSVVSTFLCSVFMPVITAAAGLEIVNNVFEEDMFSSLLDFIKYVLSMSLKVLGLAFTAVISFQRLGTTAASALAVKAAKNAVNCVPVVGDILSSSAQTVADAGAAVGNAVAAACAAAAVVISSAPVLRLTAVLIAFKVTAALTQPAGEKRITKTLNSAGDYMAILIGAVFLSAIMFVFSAVILAASF